MRKQIAFVLGLSLITILGIQAQFSKDKQKYHKFKGLFDFYYDASQAKMFLEVKELEKEFLYVNSLSHGIGSNDIGLDRGQLGGERVVYFKKMDNKLMLIQPNLDYRANTDNLLEKKSVEQAFAKSVLYGFPIVDENKGNYIIDMTSFLMQDTHGVQKRLQSNNQGNYSVDISKSGFYLERTKAFPKNIELDVMLTFKGNAKGWNIRSVTPTADLVTVHQHHSFIELPEAGFEMRAFDPRCGTYPFSFYDYATPVNQSLVKRYIPRHRLEKINPEAAVSEAVEPIIYYLDNGTPEPIRSALLDGGRWWNQAFTAAGYKDAFQFKILPDDADPMDVRYNVVQWVHRSTRGWSYGASVQDPRTGEIIKGHVSLGSLRIRQDFLIAQALSNKPFMQRDDNDKAMLELALARIRQLSAHEIGHTLGFAHNFAASTNGRSSVMDYPHPQFEIKNGKIDFSNAYDTKIGDWDKVTVAYAYSDFPKGTNEQEALQGILAKAESAGYRYLSDSDARPAGSSSAFAHLWDNGGSATHELRKVMQIRKIAIANFSKDNIRTYESFSTLEDIFVPLYFFHRYQTEATSKLIGGLDYHYAVKGSSGSPLAIVDSKQQRDALKALIQTLRAEEISIPKNKLSLFPPRSMGYGASRESFKGKTGNSFDPLSAVETAADMTLGFVLHPQRASRLIVQHSRDKSNLSLDQLLYQLIASTIKKAPKDGYFLANQQIINTKVLDHLMALQAAPNVHPQVTAITAKHIQALKSYFAKQTDVFSAYLLQKIKDYNPANFKLIGSPKIPDGSPIGMGCMHK
ncbi:MAG: zinc-dependent metalloprotease [Flavobacteriaceae bacterium]|nr:zinc-dependent metalloprotease [Flavobacteriaceae bacterium]